MPRTVILIHGMGETTGDEFREDFVERCTESLALYGLTGTWKKSSQTYSVKNGNSVRDTRVLVFGYNQFFNARRQAMADAATKVKERLGAIGLPQSMPTSIVTQLNDLSLSFTRDKFFQTHFGDVLMYAYTTVGEQIRVSLAKKLNNLIKRGTAPTDIHFVAHSLGTSVLHDTLAKDYTVAEHLGEDQLSISTHKLGSIHLVANVSRVLEWYVPVDDSFVRPGKNGCTNNFFQYNHSLDPFARVRPFNPPNDASWVSKGEYKNGYHSIKTTAISGGNTHGLGHYLLNPKNSLPMFATVFNVRFKQPQLDKANAAYNQLTLQGKAEEAREAIENINFVEGGRLKDVEKALMELSKFVRSIQDEWDA